MSTNTSDYNLVLEEKVDVYNVDFTVVLFSSSVDWRTTAEKFVGESVWADGKENHSKGQPKGSLAFISQKRNSIICIILKNLFSPFKRKEYKRFLKMVIALKNW